MATTASPPTITKDLPLFGKVTYTQGETAEPLVVEAIVTDGGTLSYQWYHSVANGSPKIAGATENSYTPPTDEIGSRSYHCEIMNKNPAGLVAWAYSNSVTVTVVAADWSGDSGDTHVCSYTPTVTDPTCTESGYIVYECDCGDSYAGGAIPATGHQWDGNTCTACGVTRKVKNTKVVDFFAGLMMGQRIKKIKNAVAKATQYLYGTPSTSGNIGLRSGESVTYYDGAVLPPLPEWDIETYPYAVIIEYGSIFSIARTASLYILPKLEYIKAANGNWCVSLGYGYKQASIVADDGNYVGREWSVFEDKTGIGLAVTGINWASFDVLNEDGGVYLPATVPIPVTGILEYNYGGEVLLPFPETDYQYALLGQYNGNYLVMLTSKPISKGIVYSIPSGSEGISYAYDEDSNKWEMVDKWGTDGSPFGFPSSVTWANYDVRASNGSVYLAASDAIPVYEIRSDLMDNIVMTMCKPIVIDYDEFGLNNTILELFATGGGRVDLGGLDLREMWSKLDNSDGKKPVIVHFTLAPMKSKFYYPAAWIHSTEVPDATCITTEGVVNNSGTHVRVIVSLERNGHGAWLDLTIATP